MDLHMTVASVSKGGATLKAKASDVVVPDGWERDADAIHRDHGVKAAELSLDFADEHPLVKGQVVTVSLEVHEPYSDLGDDSGTPATMTAPAKKAASK